MQKRKLSDKKANIGLAMAVVFMLAACAKPHSDLPPSTAYSTPSSATEAYNYKIGPGDQLQIFVWRNPEVSQSITVRPDGKITTPLVEDLQASGKTPSELARDLEKALETYIRQPIVTVIVTNGIGPYTEQIRVVGQISGTHDGGTGTSTSTNNDRGNRARAQAIAYRNRMTLLDVMVLVGGLGEFADGNRTKVVRVVDGKQQEYQVRLDDLLNGDISANVDMLPGDILIIPESWF